MSSRALAAVTQTTGIPSCEASSHNRAFGGCEEAFRAPIRSLCKFTVGLGLGFWPQNVNVVSRM